MAAISMRVRNLGNIFQKSKQAFCISDKCRTFSTSELLRKEKEEATAQTEAEEKTDNEIPIKKGWFNKLLNVRTIAPSKESHAKSLSDKQNLYEVMFHSVKPEYMEEYLRQFESYQHMMHAKTGAILKGSFTVEIGNQDEAIHIWEYTGGYPELNNATEVYRKDMDFIEFRKARNKMLNARSNQILLAFNFWPELVPREGPNIYEMRSYTLKAGTMIEWANNWSRGIQHRQSSNPVTGLFSQIGELYQVHHIWCYEDLQMRKETRESAWQKPGWDEVVQYTVPLIRHMQSRILIPTPFSPLQ